MMPKFLITRIDFDRMENNYYAALQKTNIGVAPNEEIADALIAKYQKSTEQFQYFGWGDSAKEYPYPAFVKTALCELGERYLNEAYDCKKQSEHAPVAAFGICLACGMTMDEMGKQRDEKKVSE